MTRPSNKPTLRQQCRSARQSLPSTSLQQFSKNISSKLLTLDVFQQALTVGSYMPIDNEVDTSDIHQTCWQKKAKLIATCHHWQHANGIYKLSARYKH